MEKLYTIQEIRNLIQEESDKMNPYKLLDAANGISVVQRLLSERQILDALDSTRVDE